MNDYIQGDLKRVYPRAKGGIGIIKGFRSKGFKYLFFIRKLQFSKNPLTRLFCRVIIRMLSYRYGFQIPYQTKIGPGLFIGHFGTIVISVHAKIGKNCNIAHNITIGAARGKKEGAPNIGDEVWIGTGAVLVGNISIGNNVLIAPNSYVNFDVPAHSLVIGNPGKIIPKENPTKNYINNKYND